MENKKIFKTIGFVCIASAAIITLFLILFMSVLQESYKLVPPTEQEIANDPSLARYLK